LTREKAAVAIAVVAVLGVALSATVLLVPGTQRHPAESASASTEALSSTAGAAANGSDSGSSGVHGLSCMARLETYGNMTLDVSPCASYGFPSGQVAYATLESKPAHSFIKGAYDYRLVYFGASLTNPSVTYTVLNVTGSQVVAGNWTTGYTVSYVGDRLLNVTLVHAQASTYYVSHLSDYPLPDSNLTVSFTSQQLQAIRAALSDPSVKALLANQSYYVSGAGPSGNATDGGQLVQLYQVDGTGALDVYVSASLSAVSSSHAYQRVSAVCWPDGYFIADPWSAVSSSGCAAPGGTSSAPPEPPGSA
jgi:hypothetical protein